MKKIFFIIIFFFLFFLITYPPAVSAKQTGDLELFITDPLFGSDLGWAPGREENRTFIVKNNGVETHTTVIEPYNINDPDDFSRQFFVYIKQGESFCFGGSDSKTGKQFLEIGEDVLSDVPAGGQTTYDLNFKFKPEAGNDWQGKSFSFDLRIGFKGEESVSVGGTGESNGSNQSDSAVIGNSQPPASSYPKIVSHRISVLGQSTTASQSGSIEDINKPLDEGLVAGASCSRLAALWWLPLLGQLLLTLGYFRLLKNKKNIFWWLVPLLLSALSQLIHQLYFGCDCNFSLLCPLFWLLNLAIFVFTSLRHYLGKNGR